MAVEQARAADGQVFVPLVGKTIESSILTSVHVVVGLHPTPWADDATTRIVQAAIESAWNDVGAVGAVPDYTPILGIGATNAVAGSSIYLAVYLAAVAEFGDQKLGRSILATGSFDFPLDKLNDKRALAARAKARLGIAELLYAGTGPELQIEGLRRAPSPGHARNAAFHLDPWCGGASRRQIHVHCGDLRREPPRRFNDPVFVSLPATLDATDLLVAREALGAALNGVDRAELSIGGPLMLAAALGDETRNGNAAVRIIDGKTDLPMWDNRGQWRPAPARASSSVAWVVVGPAGLGAPDGWEHHVLADNVTADDMPRVVREFLERYGNVSTLNVAFKTALPVAWAIAGMLKNQRTARYCAWTGGEYEPWFQQRPGEPGISIIGGRKRTQQRAELFLNVSNHPSADWDDAQRAAAEALAHGPVEDLPESFPTVDPAASDDEVLTLARALADRIISQAPAAVFVGGEPGVAMAATIFLLEAGLRVVTATTRREAVEVQDDGATIKRSEFRFVQWRNVSLPRTTGSTSL